MNLPINHPITIKNDDPLRTLIHEKLKLTPLAFGIIILLLNLIVDGWIGWRYDIFIKSPFPPPPPGMFQDFMAIVTDVMYTPIICGLYLWSIKGTSQVYQRLIKAKVFKDEDQITGIIDASRPIYQSKIVFWGILLISVVFGISQMGAYLNWFPWKTVGGYIDAVPVASYYRFPFWILMVYTLGYVVFNVGVTILTLIRAFNHSEISILPLHPDKCGGLGGISQYSKMIGFGIATIGLLVSAAVIYELVFGTFEEALPVIFGIPVYLLLAPIFFFLPLGSAHDSMQRAKEEELLDIAQKFNHSYSDLRKMASDDDGYDQKIVQLENIRKLYEVTESFPVWPFDTQSLRQFLVIITAPVFPALLMVLEILISRWFH